MDPEQVKDMGDWMAQQRETVDPHGVIAKWMELQKFVEYPEPEPELIPHGIQSTEPEQAPTGPREPEFNKLKPIKFV